MNNKIEFPLDNGYFRRECPLCMREFKVLLTDDELGQDMAKREDPTDVQDDQESSIGSESEMSHCPYCGQTANSDSWWTQQQLEHLEAVALSDANSILNKELIEPMKRLSGGLIKVTASRLPTRQPVQLLETDDMRIVDLHCCGRKLKVLDDHVGTVYCFFCGFPHENL